MDMFFFLYLYFMCRSVLPARVSVPRACRTYGSQKVVSDPLGLVSSHEGVGDLEEQLVLVTTEPYLWPREFVS